MEAYSGFAEVYDTFMDNVPYEDWCDYICGILKSHGIEDGLILDLACGTGRMTRLMKQKGYDMIGIDLSAEMLEIAREHENEGILYLQQDMRSFELYGTVRAIVCLCDSMNYILEEEELLQIFSLADNYLDPDGLFIFDMNTMYKYREIMGDRVFCENRDTECFVWENYFDEETSVNEYALNLFVRQENGLYGRMEEYHYQRGYEIPAVTGLLKQSGLKLLAVYGEGTLKAPEPDCERVYFVARESGKKKSLCENTTDPSLRETGLIKK